MEPLANKFHQRLDYVDLAKGCAILLVVAGHLIQCYCSKGEKEPLHAFIYGFHMPLFFLLSGFVMGITQNKLQQQPFWKWLLHKMQTLLLPYIVWKLFVYRYIDPAIQAPLDLEALKMLIIKPGEGGAWFLMSLFCIQVVCYPIFRFNRIYTWGIPLLLLVIGYLFGGSWYYCNPYHYLCFLAGFIYYKYHDKLLNPYIASVAIVCFIVFEIVYPNPFLLTLSIAISLLYACKQICTIPACSESVFFKGGLLIGRNTLAIYLLHVLIVFPVVLQHIDISSYRQTPILIITLFISFIVSLMCVGIAKITEFFPILNLVLFGKSKSR